MNSLFSDEKEITFLGVVYNDVAYERNIRDLFQPKLFDTLLVCTYVSSPKYLFKQTQEFENVELLLGIEDNINADKFIFDPSFNNDFFSSLSKENILKISDGKIKIRFTKVGTTIHSKLYIQINSKSGASRIMIGSANYSNRAFSNNDQFEELIVYDSDYNDKLTSYYINRYNTIKEHTLDFVPAYLKNKMKESELKILLLGEDESIELLKDRISEIQAAVIIPDELGDGIKRTKKLLAQQEADTQKELQSITTTKTLIEIVTKTSKDSTEFLKPIQLAKKKEQIITKTMQITKTLQKEFEDHRVKLIYSEIDTHVLIQDEQSNILNTYALKADEATLKAKLELLGKFINVYTTYTVNTEEDTQKRIFEAILYSFASVYIWRLREQAMWQQGRDEIKSAIPLFMLIAGMAQSGKTHLLKFISQMMGNHGNYYHYIKQTKLTSMTQANPAIIHQFFNDENLTPIFMDEINKEYFSSTSSTTSSYMGEGFIKNMTNSKDGRHPCLIATSNTDFSANSQVMRRIYYIQLNNPFDSTKKVETAEYFTSLLNEFGTEVYQDFLYRLEQKFIDGIAIDINDILFPAREIFMEYFSMLNMPIPKYFSHSRIDDYYIRGKEMWTNLYNMKHAGFLEKRKENIILLDDEKVFGVKMSANKDKKELIQYLPIGVLIEEKGIIKLNYEKFFDFIQDKSKKTGFFSKIFQ